MHDINLALQGGGSHGAFTWGVLDALLEDGRLGFEGISGTSAGAVNAVGLASGWAVAERAGRDPREGAREALAILWRRVSGWGSLGTLQQQFIRLLWGGLPPQLAPSHALGQPWRALVSPYQANPLDINPLRDLLEREIDFAAIARHPKLKVFVSATHVKTGKAVLFSGDRLDARAVLASACLPMLFQAVEIEGEAYWDGGYSANPALAPLLSHCTSADLLLVQINPLQRQQLPRSASDIADRASELTFNASLLTQMRAIDFINRLLAEGRLPQDRYRTLRVHRIAGGAVLHDAPTASRASADGELIARLFDSGRERAQEWLQRHRRAVGRHGTVDIPRDYLDDTRLELGASLPEPLRRLRGVGWRPWLARMLRSA